MLFVVAVLLVPASVVLLWRRISWQRLFQTEAALQITGWMIVTYIASWIYKITAVSVAVRLVAER